MLKTSLGSLRGVGLEVPQLAIRMVRMTHMEVEEEEAEEGEEGRNGWISLEILKRVVPTVAN